MVSVIEIGPLTLPIFGCLQVVGALALLAIVVLRAKAAAIAVDSLLRFAMALFGVAMLGGALWYALVYQQDAFTIPSLLSGQSILGSVAALLLAAPILGRLLQKRWLLYCDLIAPGLAAMQCVGKLACFMVGCCQGRACSMFWAVEGRQPVQLLEAGTLALIVLILLQPRLRRYTGLVSGSYLACYGLLRFLAEFLRDDSLYSWAGLTASQYLAAMICGAGIAVVRWSRGAAR